MVKRMEQDGIQIEDSEHFEMFISTIYYYEYDSKKAYKRKDGTISESRYTSRIAGFRIPMDIVKHLKLKHRDKIVIAVRRLKSNEPLVDVNQYENNG